jgi:hypothetical protein
MAKKSLYYDFNVQIWEEEGRYFYSVIQEFTEDGKDYEILGYGEVDRLEDANAAVKEIVLLHLAGI